VHYSIRDVLRWSVYHAGELGLAVGVVPACALIVLLGLFRARWRATDAERAYLAVTLAAVPLILVEVGAFASRYSLRIEERNMFYLEPLLLLALVIWLARGLPRPPGLVAAAAAVPVGLLLTLPLESFFNVSALTDTFGFTPFIRLSEALNGGVSEARTLMGLGAIVAVLLFAVLPRTIALWTIPSALAVFLMLSSGSVFAKETYIASATRHAGGLTGDPSWIDHAVGSSQRAEFLDTTEIPDPHILWQTQFWNRSVRRIFGVTANDPSIPDVTASLSAATGQIRPNLPAGSPDADPRYVVAASNVAVAGKRIAQAGFLSLYRVDPPLGLASVVSGVQPDAWMGSTASYTDYRGHVPHRLRVLVWRPKLHGPPPARVRVTVGSVRATGLPTVWATQSWTVKNGSRHLFTLPIRGAPFQVRLTADPTFVPSAYGLADTRILGVQVSFSLGAG
jgi:hypothetical protein